jgi:hypothetical protein
MKLSLFLSLLLFCTIAKSQTEIELKDFITKNSVAIRTVQKNMIREGSSDYVASFKNILKNQEAAVKLYNSDRTESLEFLKKHTQGSTEYFEITTSEKNYNKSLTQENTKVLSDSEIKTIEALDAMNTQSLNNLNLTIQ